MLLVKLNKMLKNDSMVFMIFFFIKIKVYVIHSYNMPFGNSHLSKNITPFALAVVRNLLL